jgi:hypothetical protein
MGSKFLLLSFYFIALFTFTYSVPLQAQNNVVIQGKVLDAQDQKPIDGASITISTSGKGTATNAQGAFKLEASPNAVLDVS